VLQEPGKPYGSDATPTSLHVGSLLQIMMLRHFPARGAANLFV